tara:strand:+ start:235 stop:741 length:507 start_codon:yes stop_codon:yes gene_type:complete
MDRTGAKPVAGRRSFGIGLVVAALIAFADLSSKWVMETVFMEPPRVIPVLPFFNIVLVFNRGISFGLLGDVGPWGPIILSALAVAIVGLLLVWLRRTERSGEAFGIAMIVGGASGNIVDRLHDGAVTDFLDFYADHYHWPAFNGADIFITLGVACLIISSIGFGKNRT